MSVRDRTLNAQIDRRAADIYDRSKTLALKGGVPDELDTDYGEMIICCGKRSSAMAYFAAEQMCEYIDVRCTRAWMRVDLDAIRDRANDIAYDEAHGDDEIIPDAIAYTWDNEGWTWRDCKQTDAGAIGFWRCAERAR